jgi:hypothetical protein
MYTKFSLGIIASFLLTGLVWAADEPETKSQDAVPAEKIAVPQNAEQQSSGTFTGWGTMTNNGSGSFQIMPGMQPPSQFQFFQGNFGVPTPPYALREYWVGIECSPVLPVLRVHLDLAENEGLVADNIVPDSPAAKAGIENYDILLSAAGKKLSSVEDLLEAIDASKETPMTMEIIHEGKPKTLELTPAKRSQPSFAQFGGTNQDRQTVKTWMNKVRRGEILGQPGNWQYRVIQPGTILPPNSTGSEPPLPGNMSINISRSSDKPAKISVSFNDKKWEVAENDLDKLPEEVRPHVERMLGRMKMGIMSAEAMNFPPDVLIPAPPQQGMPTIGGPLPHSVPMEKQLQEMNRNIEELQKSMQEQQKEMMRLIQQFPIPPASKDAEEDK